MFVIGCMHMYDYFAGDLNIRCESDVSSDIVHLTVSYHAHHVVMNSSKLVVMNSVQHILFFRRLRLLVDVRFMFEQLSNL